MLVGALAGCGGTEGEGATTMLLPDRIGEWARQDPSETYNRETIFDYINGAGEVYRSYAFEDVRVTRYTRDGEKITVELFDMGTAADAYGVFSYARESEEDGIGGGFERKGSVLCFWQNRYYVCVATHELGTDRSAGLEEIARGIARQLPAGGDRPSLVSALPTNGLLPASDRYFHTHQSLNYHYYVARENLLSLSEETDVVLGRYEPGSTYVVIVSYPSAEEARAALLHFVQQRFPESAELATIETTGGTFFAFDHTGQFVVVVMDAATREAAEALRDAARNRIDQLAP